MFKVCFPSTLSPIFKSWGKLTGCSGSDRCHNHDSALPQLITAPVCGAGEHVPGPADLPMASAPLSAGTSQGQLPPESHELWGKEAA